MPKTVKVVEYDNTADIDKAALLKARVKEGESCDHQDNCNTLLHQAILAGDREFALKLIDIDCEKDPEGTILNNSVWGNTPLLLALKVGLFDVAAKILEAPQLDVTVFDNLGMTPMHWAALFRQDALLEMLMERKALTDLMPSTTRWYPGNSIVLRLLKPSDLYQINLCALDRLLLPDFIADESNQSCFLGNSIFLAQITSVNKSLLRSPVSKRMDILKRPIHKELAMPTCMTDLLYHMNLVSKNWCGIDKEVFSKEYSRTCDKFRECFTEGYPDFRDFRNQQPVSDALLEKLQQHETAFSMPLADVLGDNYLLEDIVARKEQTSHSPTYRY